MMNKDLERTISDLRTAGRKTGHPIYKALAEELDKPKRIRVSVNLSRISRLTEGGDVVAVPGKVLASGALAHPVTVAAYAFSDLARQKIAAAGGSTKTLQQLASDASASRVKLVK